MGELNKCLDEVRNRQDMGRSLECGLMMRDAEETIQLVRRFFNRKYLLEANRNDAEKICSRVAKLEVLLDSLNTYLIETLHFYIEDISKIRTLKAINFEPLEMPLLPDLGIANWSTSLRSPYISTVGKAASNISNMQFSIGGIAI